MCLREWRDLRHRWPGALLLLGLGGAVAWWAPPQHAVPALVALAALVAVGGTAQRLWREGRSGGFSRLALTGIPPGRLMAARVLARAAATAALVVPAALLAGWRHPDASALAGALAAAGAAAAGAAVGSAVGLRARQRRHLYPLIGTAATGLALAAWLPAPAAPALDAAAFLLVIWQAPNLLRE